MISRIHSDVLGRPKAPPSKSILGKRFVWTPFSILNAMSKDWQRRKREWISLGIQSELGRGENLLKFSDTVSYHTDENGKKTVGKGRQGLAQSYRMDQYIDEYRGDKKYHAQPGGGPSKKSVWLGSNGKPVGGVDAINGFKQGMTYGEITGYDGYDRSVSGTSIFDPVLCEIMYKWFVPKGGLILDPFAGGSVRGVVASCLGYTYVGIDLRPEQLEANEQQAELICPDNMPFWIEGDSRDISELVGDLKFDFLFACPPYFDLELYSGDKRDLSNTTWEKFCEDYSTIIRLSTNLLNDNSFACFVVGDIRDKQGYYRSLPSVTIKAFEDAGLRLYNECILCTATGSLPLRVNRQFSKSRKVGKTHQNVLVFVKNDPVKAAEKLPELQFYEGVNSDAT